MTKSTWRQAAALAACLFGGAAVAAVEKPAAAPAALQSGKTLTNAERYVERVRQAIALLEGGDAAAALKAFDAVLADPLLATFNPQQRAITRWMGGIAAWQTGDARTARDRFQRAVEDYGDEPDLWQALASVEQQLGNRDRASLYFSKLLGRWPDRVSALEMHVVNDLVFRSAVASDQRLALMQALFGAGWSQNGRGASATWRELALALLARGQADTARTVVRRIEEPLVIIDLRSDLRFDPVADTIATMPSVEDAARTEVERLRALVAQAPQRVDLAGDLGSALLIAGRNDEALAQSDAALAAITTADAATLEHLDERVWIMNNRAIALRRLGRLDDAAAEMERARRLDEGGGTNVSQSLNLGMLYCHMGRPVEARRVLGELGLLSDYGRMVERSVRHCIAMLEGDEPEARRLVTQLYDRRSDGEAVVLNVLMRSGDTERAAAELIRQLGAPESRDDALDSVHGYLAAPVLPGTASVRKTHAAVLQRADVQAAIAAVGRAGRFGVHDLTGIE